ncbi:hypothetical protein [Nonomuraea sp. SYSU D8015]|uniref:hypothetical protein n=1 Tax=Nonomuraea sp. SYSU D8015 TaxID=2593644 RepID=UPI001660380A|nr:hypothetical protein [Nonomuraea sp. SYSU D8015]
MLTRAAEYPLTPLFILGLDPVVPVLLIGVWALRAARSQIALVRAEDDTVAGIVSLDDLLTTLLVPA